MIFLSKLKFHNFEVTTREGKLFSSKTLNHDLLSYHQPQESHLAASIFNFLSAPKISFQMCRIEYVHAFK